MAITFPLWRSSFAFLSFACIYASVVRSATINITVTVPAGSSNHGLSSYVCVPTKWYDVIVFFGANFFAHAATIRTLPGERPKEVAFTVILALLFPFSGISRGVEAIVRHASWPPCSGLRCAARAGALCIVTRTWLWGPVRNTVLKGLIFPNTLEEQSNVYGYTVGKDRQQGLISTEYRYSGEIGAKPIARRVIHGVNQQCLDDSYDVAILPSNTQIELRRRDTPRSNHTDNIHCEHERTLAITSMYNVPQMLVAIVQLAYSSVTLYRTKGDQLDRFGYAAFGLTVLPYLIMSAMNLVGNLLTPTYPYLYMVCSEEMEELEVRAGSQGRLTGTVAHIPFQTTEEPERWALNTIAYWLSISVALLLPLPYVVIGALTRFHPNNSSHVQRIFTMYWLAVGIIVGAAIPFWKPNTSIKPFMFGLIRILPLLTKYPLPGLIEFFILMGWYTLVFLSSSAALGGFVVVAQMIKEYGSCTRF
ncbi:hypothetical protein AOQ84DRAFT_402594 [Glonium stellatum]|uniref:Uncharacterized protein n=1 Tax=Glonium stellatum TaxID=574774 RepID=A0A8E2F406_9PEZI|nr:hypothetical protein AOQ84DRAFT_402594 [Glonium stellatum]